MCECVRGSHVEAWPPSVGLRLALRLPLAMACRLPQAAGRGTYYRSLWQLSSEFSSDGSRARAASRLIFREGSEDEKRCYRSKCFLSIARADTHIKTIK